MPPATFFHEQERADKKVAKKPLFPIFDNLKSKVTIVMRITCPDSYPGIIQYLKIIFYPFILAV